MLQSNGTVHGKRVGSMCEGKHWVVRLFYAVIKSRQSLPTTTTLLYVSQRASIPHNL